MIVSLALAVLTNPFAGSYTGSYRAGFLNPKPLTVSIATDGTTHMATPYQTLHGETDNSGNFDVKAGPVRWIGSLHWDGPTLVGTFTAYAGGRPVSGNVWATPN